MWLLRSKADIYLENSHLYKGTIFTLERAIYFQAMKRIPFHHQEFYIIPTRIIHHKSDIPPTLCSTFDIWCHSHFQYDKCCGTLNQKPKMPYDENKPTFSRIGYTSSSIIFGWGRANINTETSLWVIYISPTKLNTTTVQPNSRAPT